MTPDERKVMATLRALVAQLGLQLAASDQLVAELREELRERAEAHEAAEARGATLCGLGWFWPFDD